ncbi:MAG: hypothetical protein SVY15_04755 [Halobacteriota archaeon]|nr:hypothetical protein [Halobacteriota archaeon]
MTEDLNLKELEMKAWASYFEDGLWDLFFGIILITSAVRSLTDNVWFTFGIFGAILLNILGKRYFTIPRIGLVKFGPKREMRQVKMMLIILIMLLVILYLGTLMTQTAFPVMALWLAVLFFLLGFLMDFSHFYVYGLIFASSEVISRTYGDPFAPLSNLIFGSGLLLVGLLILSRFLKKYPLQSGGTPNDYRG